MTGGVYIFILLCIFTSINTTFGCFHSIISFGDSLTDTGNLLHLLASAHKTNHAANPPYGESYFHHPTGRFSDGRLVIDFIAEHYGLPFVVPYFGRNAKKKAFFGEGVNFAVAGATALDYTYLAETHQVYNPTTNVSLETEIGWFKEMMADACRISSDCKEILRSSLVLMGEIGGNEISYAFLQGKSKEEVQTLTGPIVNTISSAIKEVIELGSLTIMVPGNLPIGCITMFLTYFSGSDKKDYDPSTGCIVWLNKLSQRYNERLQVELDHIRRMYPHANIIYADYYNAAMQLFSSPRKYGFTRTLTACCGSGGRYNYNLSTECGYPPTTSCEDPYSYINWDGIHMTEAAYRFIAQGLIQGHYSIPHINKLCPSVHKNKIADS